MLVVQPAANWICSLESPVSSLPSHHHKHHRTSQEAGGGPTWTTQITRQFTEGWWWGISLYPAQWYTSIMTRPTILTHHSHLKYPHMTISDHNNILADWCRIKSCLTQSVKGDNEEFPNTPLCSGSEQVGIPPLLRAGGPTLCSPPQRNLMAGSALYLNIIGTLNSIASILSSH